MRNLLSLVGLVVVVFLGAGWYLGWYKLGVTKGNTGNVQVSFDVDTSKIKDDTSKGVNKVGDIVNGLKKEPTETSKDFVGPTLPSDWTPPSNSKSTPTNR